LIELLTKEIVARDDHDIVVDCLLRQDQIDVANRPEPVRLVRRLVIDDGNGRAFMFCRIGIGPTLKMANLALVTM
jgi:hypothetical protein